MENGLPVWYDEFPNAVPFIDEFPTVVENGLPVWYDDVWFPNAVPVIGGSRGGSGIADTAKNIAERATTTILVINPTLEAVLTCLDVDVDVTGFFSSSFSSSTTLFVGLDKNLSFPSINISLSYKREKTININLNKQSFSLPTNNVLSFPDLASAGSAFLLFPSSNACSLYIVVTTCKYKVNNSDFCVNLFVLSLLIIFCNS